MLRNSTQSVCLNSLVAVAVLAGLAAPVQAKEKLLVLLYNASPVEPQVLAAALKEVSRIFREAGLELQWMDCPQMQAGRPETDKCRERFDKSPLYLHIAAAAGAFPNPTSLAHAAVSAEGGIRTVVFFDRVQKFLASAGRGCDRAQFLGHVMAHEIGHLLLLMPGHSPKGIMVGPWDKKDLQQAGLGKLLFTPQEAAKMRAEVRRRL